MEITEKKSKLKDVLIGVEVQTNCIYDWNLESHKWLEGAGDKKSTENIHPGSSKKKEYNWYVEYRIMIWRMRMREKMYQRQHSILLLFTYPHLCIPPQSTRGSSWIDAEEELNKWMKDSVAQFRQRLSQKDSSRINIEESHPGIAYRKWKWKTDKKP